ncbi:MAG TPA: DUF883 family protein [Rhodocyclaceae bacterium]|nr:DUF883 family protein [Rhodocyclaceae bacterium]
MSNDAQVNKDKLIADFKVVIADAEEILRVTAGQAGEKMADLREKAQARLSDAKYKLAEAEAIVVDKAKAAGRAADDYVHDNPWRAVGIAAGVGLVVGLLIGRR